MIVWERSFRRKSGANPDSYDDADRVVGPWHIKPSDREGYTQCGKQLKMISVNRTKTESLEDSPEGKICRTCVIWYERGHMKAVRH